MSAAIAAGNPKLIRDLVGPLHYSQAANLIEGLDRDDRRRLIDLAGDILDAEFLTELDETVRDEAIDALGTAQFASALTELDTDDAVDLIEDLDAGEQRAILDGLDAIPWAPTCPHGRPVAVPVELAEIERRFGRR